MNRSRAAKSVVTARNVGGIFFPQRDRLCLGCETFSPCVREKVMLVAVETRSFQRAAIVLEKVGEILISGRHVGRVTRQVGAQRARVEAHRQGQLRVEVPNPPQLAIVDFIHVLSYLYRAAVAIGEDEDFGWGLCLEWATACWQGRVDDVLIELREWLAAQPVAEAELADDDPRHIVGRAITYLTNNRGRMNYPRYRRQGLPLTSALMESCIKEINYRVKGSGKFWNDPSSAEAILALKAASLCDDSRLENSLQT